MASGTGTWYGDSMSTGNSSARKYVTINSTSFNTSTGVTTIKYSVGIKVDSGNFQGSQVTSSVSSYTETVSLYGSGNYGTHSGLSTTVAHNTYKKFYEWCGYTSSSAGYIDSEVSFNWYPTLPTYTVAYNANGGSGAPSSQTKKWGTNITLSSTVPTRTNYVFKNWNTASGGSGTSYSKGATYSSNTGVTLYAQWYAPYTVSYDANGGTGAPSSQIKVYNTTLKLSTTKPTRAGHTFLGWATSSSATTATVQPGANYTTNANVTYYAVWQINTWTVSYDGNNATSGTTTSQTKTYGETLVLRSNGFSRTQYNFVEWNTNAAGTGTSYAEGGNYTENTAVTLYAIWEIAHANPIISGLLVQRCDSMGALADDGEYCKVTASVSVDYSTVGYENTVLSSVTVKVGSNAEETVSGISPSATSANISFVSVNQVSLTSVYEVTLTVVDSAGFSTVRSSQLSVAYYTMYFKAGGRGIGIGKSTAKDALDIGMETWFDDRVKMQSKTIERGNPGASDIFGGSGSIQLVDKDSNQIGYMQSVQTSSGEEGIQIGSNNEDSSNFNTLMLGFDSNGDPIVDLSSPDTWVEELGVVKKTGDTMSGNLIFNTAGSVYEYTSIDSTSNPAEQLTSNSYQLYDSNGIIIGQHRAVQYTDGRIGFFLIARQGRSTDSGGIKQTFFGPIMSPSGETSYLVTSPSAFCDAIGIGTLVTKDISTSVAVANSSYKSIGSVAITPGVWMITGGLSFASNATGRRYITLATSADAASSGAWDRGSAVSQMAVNGSTSRLHTSMIATFTASSTSIYLTAWQNSGSSLNCTGYIRAVKISS